LASAWTHHHSISSTTSSTAATTAGSSVSLQHVSTQFTTFSPYGSLTYEIDLIHVIA
jgi:hypothetical protein